MLPATYLSCDIYIYICYVYMYVYDCAFRRFNDYCTLTLTGKISLEPTKSEVEKYEPIKVWGFTTSIQQTKT